VQIDEAAVPVELFRKACREWRRPGPNDARSWFAIGDDQWTPITLVARGEIADVHLAERARWPTEHALIKVLRSADDLPMLDAEWSALTHLQSSDAAGARAIAPRLPQPIAHGVVEDGPDAGKPATVLRWAPGFDHTLEVVRSAHPGGVSEHVAVWMWRRILETLAFLHRSGIVHGAVLPQHLIVERGEHGVRLVGYGCAGRANDPLAAVVVRHEALYPERLLASQRLAPEHDIAMSARCIAHVLGADAKGSIPAGVFGALRKLLESAACGEDASDAWTLHERVGKIASEHFGPPSFHPLVMPDIGRFH
jgi:hypothetical protein